MEREKIEILARRLQEEHVVCFRLYNALYTITFIQGRLCIRQDGLDICYYFSSLQELLQHFVVYGNTLLESIQDIRIV